MYQLLLCWRYLRTRYIALASITSVMLGVATMIVVNSVMSGFTTEMQERIHNILSDVVVDSLSLSGFADAEGHMQKIREVAGDEVEWMTATVVVPAMLSFEGREGWIHQDIQLVGADAEGQSRVSAFRQYLQHPQNRNGQISFDLRDGGYDVLDHQAGPDAEPREQMALAGWEYRRRLAEYKAFQRKMSGSDNKAAVDSSETDPDPFAARETPVVQEFDMASQQDVGAMLGIAIAMHRQETDEGDFEDRFHLLPGDDVILTVPNAADPSTGSLPEAAHAKFTVVDFWESKMSDYDSKFVFVPLEELQALRGMYDPSTGAKFVNSIQIKLKPGADGKVVRDKLREVFSPYQYMVSTWRDKQGALLAAVQMETAILNVLLFLIITVAGFGILAIFLMIVVEKTRDIGILKSLGASSWGIQGIFLSYGLSLGLVGSGVGMVLGLLFVGNINEIADWLGWITGRPVFDPEIYYFYKIPTIVEPWTVAWIVIGAISIAVMASILPAFRASRLHPVEALRYE